MRDMSFNVFALRKKVSIRILLKSLIWALALLGVLFILIMGIVLGYLRTPSLIAEVPEKAVLMINLDNGFDEARQDDLLNEVVQNSSLSFFDVLAVMEAALYDDRIKAVAAKIGNTKLGLAQLEEFYQMISEYQAAGKKVYVYSSGFGGLAGGTAEYFLATAFDEITMMPESDVGITGVGIEMPFVRGALDKLGVMPEFYSRHEYKGGMFSFTDKEVSKVYKVHTNQVLANLNLSLFRIIEWARFGVDDSIDEITDLVNEAPFTAEYAKKKGLIDNIEYEYDWRKKIEKEHDAQIISFEDYVNTVTINNKGKKIALVQLDGVIVDDENIGFISEKQISLPKVLRIVRDIEKDEDVIGVLLRINSPGGSYSASSEIWNAFNKLKKEKNIPLYVSMGDYAASGGYFVALAGDKIYASRTSLTGSIGVFGGKFVLEDLWKKLDVNWEVFALNPNASLLSPNSKFDADQKKVFEKSLDRVYESFTQKVAVARKKSFADMEWVARGRVWTGKQAKELDLVDELGGLRDALSGLLKECEAEKNKGVAIAVYPKPKTLQEKLAAAIGMSSGEGAKITGKILGIDSNIVSVIQRLQYDAILPPMVVKY